MKFVQYNTKIIVSMSTELNLPRNCNAIINFGFLNPFSCNICGTHSNSKYGQSELPNTESLFIGGGRFSLYDNNSSRQLILLMGDLFCTS